MINEKNLNFPRILCLNEQNDPRPRHQLSRLEAAKTTNGKTRSQFPSSFQHFHEVDDDDRKYSGYCEDIFLSKLPSTAWLIRASDAAQ